MPPSAADQFCGHNDPNCIYDEKVKAKNECSGAVDTDAKGNPVNLCCLYQGYNVHCTAQVPFVGDCGIRYWMQKKDEFVNRPCIQVDFSPEETQGVCQ
jgi:hypothetical protein